jgi:phage-related protein
MYDYGNPFAAAAVGEDIANIFGAQSNVLQDVAGETQSAINGINTVGNSIATVAGATQSSLQALGNIYKNVGVFAIGALLIFGGIVWMAFSWGEDLALSVDKWASLAAKVAPIE